MGRCKFGENTETGRGVWAMLPSAGHSHTAERVPAPVLISALSNAMFQWPSRYMGGPNCSGFPAMGACVPSQCFLGAAKPFLLLLSYSHPPAPHGDPLHPITLSSPCPCPQGSPSWWPPPGKWWRWDRP